MLEIACGVATDPGTHRTINEDSHFVASRLAAVADGMGGHAAGEVASCIVVERLELLATSASSISPDELLAAIADANQHILDEATAEPSRHGMGTTLAGVGVASIGGSDHWVVFNVGDSRVYQLTETSLSQLTIDHSEVEELVAAGVLTEGEARVDPRRNIVTRSLGTDPAPQADVWVFPPTPGERFLVCSDGLTLEMTDDQISRILRGQRDPQRAADELVTGAVAAGGRDNVTVVVVDAVADDPDDSVCVDTAPRPEPGDDPT